MHPPHPDSEAALENATIELFSQLQWETANCYHETFGTNSTLGRETKGEVVLIPKLQLAVKNLNPDLPTEAIQLAIEELTRDRSTLSLANANAEIYQFLKDGVKVSFKAILPDPAANEFTAINAYLQAIKDQILAEVPEVDVSEVMEQVEELLDLSITAGEFVIQESHSQRIDLSQIDFVALKNKFASTDYQRTETEKLKTAIAQKVQQMVRLNKTRINYLDKFQQMIAEYNADSRNVQIFFNNLINFAQELGVEDKRAIAQNLKISKVKALPSLINFL